MKAFWLVPLIKPEESARLGTPLDMNAVPEPGEE
jgi:hypothetical protein